MKQNKKKRTKRGFVKKMKEKWKIQNGKRYKIIEKVGKLK
jgi:hypothetical protein